MNFLSLLLFSVWKWVFREVNETLSCQRRTFPTNKNCAKTKDLLNEMFNWIIHPYGCRYVHTFVWLFVNKFHMKLVQIVNVTVFWISWRAWNFSHEFKCWLAFGTSSESNELIECNVGTECTLCNAMYNNSDYLYTG